MVHFAQIRKNNPTTVGSLLPTFAGLLPSFLEFLFLFSPMLANSCLFGRPKRGQVPERDKSKKNRESGNCAPLFLEFAHLSAELSSGGDEEDGGKGGGKGGQRGDEDFRVAGSIWRTGARAGQMKVEPHAYAVVVAAAAHHPVTHQRET